MRITAAAWRALVQHVEAARGEACAALFARAGAPIDLVAPLPNVAADAARAFVVDDAAHLRALVDAERAGRVEVAIAHTHAGGTTPSRADVDGMRFADGAPRFPGVAVVVIATDGGQVIGARAWSVDGPMPRDLGPVAPPAMLAP